MNQAALDEITALEQEVDGQRKRIREQAAEIAALREVCRKVLDYNEGVGEFDYSTLPAIDRANAAFDAWTEIREQIRLALEWER